MELYRFFVRSLLRRGRLIGIGAVGALLVGLAAAIAYGPGSQGAGFELVERLGLTLLAPVAALAFASAVLGDPAEDETLVYIWLHPVARWRMALAAWSAALTVLVPLVVGPVAAAGGLSGGARLAGAAAASALLAIAVYGALFVALGILVRRALVWGLLFVVVWESVVETVGTAAGRGSIRLYTTSLLARLADHPAPDATSAQTAILVGAGVTAAALALATWRLRRMDVK